MKPRTQPRAGRLRRFFSSASGAATVEFVIVFPFFFSVFVSSFEVAMMNIRALMIERATDITIRDIRLSTGHNLDYGDVVHEVCSLTMMVPDCENVIRVEMRPVDQSEWATLGNAAECVNRNEEIQPLVHFQNGQENELMLVRVCAVLDPFFPTVGIGRTMPKDATGAYIVTASGAFVNEPN